MRRRDMRADVRVARRFSERTGFCLRLFTFVYRFIFRRSLISLIFGYAAFFFISIHVCLMPFLCCPARSRRVTCRLYAML